MTRTNTSDPVHSDPVHDVLVAGVLRVHAESILAQLAKDEAVVVDGDWVERFTARLLDPDQVRAADAAREAIQDQEVLLASDVVIAFARAKAIPRSALAAALRMVCIDQGLFADPATFSFVFHEARKAVNFLMTPEEIAALAALPESVPVYRGQLVVAGPMPTAASWTLAKEVAEWYSAPSQLDRRNGWVLSTTVAKGAVVALFLERAEQEVLLDFTGRALLRPVTARRGRCTSFPAHLAESRLGSAGLIGMLIASLQRP